jgi:nicotinamidase/pyrazinamidase
VTRLVTDYQIAYSAHDAVHLGLTVVVLEDACRAIGLNGSLACATNEMRSAGVTIGLTTDGL